MVSSVRRNASGTMRTYEALRNSLFLGGDDITHAEPEISPRSSILLDAHDQDPRVKSTYSTIRIQGPNVSLDDAMVNPPFFLERKPVGLWNDHRALILNEGKAPTQYSLSPEPFNPPAWKILWLRPVFIILMPFLGLFLALGHHFYYLSLQHTSSGDAAKQAWPIRFGTGFAFLVTSCLHAGTALAGGQYVWTVVKRKPLSIASLDKIFAMTSNPLSLFSWELLRRAKIALFFGLVFWLLGWSGVAPPATLTVVAQNLNYKISIPMLDYTQSGWNTSRAYWEPGAEVNRIAAQTATIFDVVPLVRPVSSTDWDYTIQFFGPSFQCNSPNSTEQRYFDTLIRKFEIDYSTFPYSRVNDSVYNFASPPKWLLHSAWAPGLPTQAPNFWAPLGTNFGDGLAIDARIDPPQIWIQTSTSSIICTSLNASFEVNVASVNGTQQITQQDIHVIGNIL